ncbi:MAG: hypothetical protein AB9888_08210 [Bacteroidales bacterium]
MIEIGEFKKLKPYSESGGSEYLPFELFCFKFKKFLPNFPECVIEQWPYEQFSDFCDKYWWLEYERLYFEKVLFSKDQIMLIGTTFLDTQDYWGDEFIEVPNFRAEQTRLGIYMSNHKTWPKPIIIFDICNSNIEETDELCQPFHLLEGHMRLAYMRAFIRHSIEGVNPKHEVWLARKL